MAGGNSSSALGINNIFYAVFAQTQSPVCLGLVRKLANYIVINRNGTIKIFLLAIAVRPFKKFFALFACHSRQRLPCAAVFAFYNGVLALGQHCSAHFTLKYAHLILPP